MKRRITALLLSAAMCLTLCACGETEKEKLDVGKTASTDLAEFTLIDAQFAYYLDNHVNDNYLVPIEETDTMFAASVGHCYVSLTFTLTSKDRGNHISFAGTFGDWDPNFEVTYSGESYTVRGFDLNDNDGSDRLNLSFAASINKETGKLTGQISTDNYLLDAGKTITIRTFGVVAVDPENLTDGFDLSVDVPNSKGEYETFVYTIPAKA